MFTEEASNTCAVLIDGSNFYYKLRDLRLADLVNFNFGKFAGFLSANYKPVVRKYYIGGIRKNADYRDKDQEEKLEKLYEDQQKLFVQLKDYDYEEELGFLLEAGGTVHEKGVDVHMATDILSYAYEKTVDKVMLVSSDTDLIPAIEQAQKKGLHVEYIGFKHLPSRALKDVCKSTRLLSRDDVKGFYK
jgi:uncharacterized LabA/DUF88 family protein